MKYLQKRNIPTLLKIKKTPVLINKAVDIEKFSLKEFTLRDITLPLNILWRVNSVLGGRHRFSYDKSKQWIYQYLSSKDEMNEKKIIYSVYFSSTVNVKWSETYSSTFPYFSTR